MILIEHGPAGKATLFSSPEQVFVAYRLEEVAQALAAAEDARQAGAWIAGYIAYEAGFAHEPRLADLPVGDEPLVCLAAFAAPQDADAAFAAADAAKGGITALTPVITPEAYGTAFAKVKNYIAAGDCYQINLTFPMAGRYSGTPLGLYGALRRAQPVGFGAFVDLGLGPVIVSRSPELFFRVSGDVIESRPMKGTAPRSDDPVEDAALARELRESDKGRAENLMIVDLLRNDISRISQVGSVKVPELFAIESFATVHQMSSLVRGQLLSGAGLPALMTALFPCGSITGAPKIRAMQIIAEVEPGPRGIYCGAIGWASPEGAQCWSVAIRTLRLWPDGRLRLNVGGGVVQDSTESGEWEEALWKARYASNLIQSG